VSDGVAELVLGLQPHISGVDEAAPAIGTCLWRTWRWLRVSGVPAVLPGFVIVTLADWPGADVRSRGSGFGQLASIP